MRMQVKRSMQPSNKHGGMLPSRTILHPLFSFHHDDNSCDYDSEEEELYWNEHENDDLIELYGGVLSTRNFEHKGYVIKEEELSNKLVVGEEKDGDTKEYKRLRTTTSPPPSDLPETPIPLVPSPPANIILPSDFVMSTPVNCPDLTSNTGHLPKKKRVPTTMKFPWLLIEGKLGHSEKDLASGKDLSQIKKKHKRAMCTSYCAEFAPQSPWATMRARYCCIEDYLTHDCSLDHERACELRNKQQEQLFQQVVEDDEKETTEADDDNSYDGSDESDDDDDCCMGEFDNDDDDDEEVDDDDEMIIFPSSKCTPITQTNQQLQQVTAQILAGTPVKKTSDAAPLPKRSRGVTFYRFHCKLFEAKNTSFRNHKELLNTVCLLEAESDRFPLKYIQSRGPRGFLNVVNSQYNIRKAFASVSTVVYMAELILLALLPPVDQRILRLNELLQIGNYQVVQSFATSIRNKLKAENIIVPVDNYRNDKKKEKIDVIQQAYDHQFMLYLENHCADDKKAARSQTERNKKRNKKRKRKRRAVR